MSVDTRIRYAELLDFSIHFQFITQFIKAVKVMSVIYVLIPIAVLLTALGIYLFFWAVKTEQFDDLEKQGLSILFDDEGRPVEKSKDDEISDTETSSAEQAEQNKDDNSSNNRAPQ